MKHSMGMSTTYIYGIKGSILFKNERKNNVTGVAVGEDDRCLGTKRVSLLYVQISSLQVFFLHRSNNEGLLLYQLKICRRSLPIIIRSYGVYFYHYY